MTSNLNQFSVCVTPRSVCVSCANPTPSSKRSWRYTEHFTYPAYTCNSFGVYGIFKAKMPWVLTALSPSSVPNQIRHSLSWFSVKNEFLAPTCSICRRLRTGATSIVSTTCPTHENRKKQIQTLDYPTRPIGWTVSVYLLYFVDYCRAE